jgi:phosphatidate cytidylyltransferase
LFTFHYGAKVLVHLKRWITGLSALPVLILLIYTGGYLFLLLVALACICAQWEYHRIVSNADPAVMSSIVVWWGYCTSLLLLAAAHIAGIGLVAAGLALNLVVVGVMSVFLYKSNPRIGLVIQKQVLGIVYIPLSLSLLAVIRNEPDGMVYIFLLLAIIFAGDTSAFYVGTYLGRHKLSPAISPGKTVEGALGGLSGNLLAGSIGVGFFMPSIDWGAGILFFLAAGIAGQVGDLFESEMKRSSDIKDSGGLLPGHGGFLDRIDALLFASPVAYLFKMYIL